MKRSLSLVLPSALLACLLAAVADLLGAPLPPSLGGASGLGFFCAAALLALAIDDYRRSPSLSPRRVASRGAGPFPVPAAAAFAGRRPDARPVVVAQA
jgi:hypothetical protein